MQKEKRKIIIGARGSKLSLVYAEHVKRLLLQANSQFPPESNTLLQDNSVLTKDKNRQ